MSDRVVLRGTFFPLGVELNEDLDLTHKFNEGGFQACDEFVKGWVEKGYLRPGYYWMLIKFPEGEILEEYLPKQVAV